MLHNTVTMDLLQGLSLFETCSRRSLSLLSRVVEDVRIGAGQVLMDEHDAYGFECLVVVDGLLEVTREGRQVAVVGPGEVVGEMALLEGPRRRATVQTLTPTRLLAFDRRAFAALLDIPEPAARLRELCASRSRRCADVLVEETAAPR